MNYHFLLSEREPSFLFQLPQSFHEAVSDSFKGPPQTLWSPDKDLGPRFSIFFLATIGNPDNGLSFVWASSLFSWSPWCHISQTNGCPALCLSFKNWKIVQRFLLLLQLLLHLLNHHILLHPPLLLCAGQPLRHCLLVCCYDTNLNTNQPKSWGFYSHCFWLFVLQPVPTSQDFSDRQTWQRQSCSCCWSDSDFQPSALHDPLLVLELLLTAHWVSAHHASTKPPISITKQNTRQYLLNKSRSYRVILAFLLISSLFWSPAPLDLKKSPNQNKQNRQIQQK